MEPLVVTVAALTLVSSAFVGHTWRTSVRRRTPERSPGAAPVVHPAHAVEEELRAVATGSRLTVRAREVGDDTPPVGDGLFDTAVVVAGDAVARCAALDAATRDLLVTFVQRGGSVHDGTVQLRPTQAGASPTDEPDVDLLARVRTSLSAAAVEDPLTRIERIIQRDRQVGVQLGALEVYVNAAGRAPRALQISRDLIHRSHGALRLRAAKHLQEPSSWLRIAVDYQEAAHVREAALRALFEVGDEAVCDEAIGVGLTGPDGLTLATLELLAGAKGEAWALTLTQMVAEAWIDVKLSGSRFRDDAILGAALLRAFTAHAEPTDEPELLEIAFQEDNDLADLAWRALERVGTPVALHAIEHRQLPRHESVIARTHRHRAADHVLQVLRRRWVSTRSNSGSRAAQAALLGAVV